MPASILCFGDVIALSNNLINGSIEEYKFYKKTEKSGRTGKEEDFSLFGALPYGGIIVFELRAKRFKGLSDVNLVILKDSVPEGAKDAEKNGFPLSIYSVDGENDIYRVEIPTDRLLSGKESGLFFYYYEADSFDGRIQLAGEQATELLPLEAAGKRQFLIYKGDFTTPDFFKSGTVYHIFVDRFRSSGRCKLKDGARLNPDWKNGIPEYPEYRGEPLKNNEFFGGDLYGIIEKLDYLLSIGITVIYLIQIFESV